MRCDRLYVLYMIFTLNPEVVGVIHPFYENEFPAEINENFDTKNIKPYQYNPRLHFGHMAFRRILFDKFKYSNKPRGQDIEFVEFILPEYINQLRIYDKPLTYYISDRSTFYA
jgi:hypothetical protein